TRPRTVSAWLRKQLLILQLSLAVGLLLSQESLAQSEGKITGLNTPCSAVRELGLGKCMAYMAEGGTYVLCNGPYSLCTAAGCTSLSNQKAQCSCVVETRGLSIRTEGANQGATSALSNFSLAQFPFTSKECSSAPLVTCLNAPCTVSSTDNTASSCTCP